MQAYASLDALAHTLKEIEPQKFGDKLTYLEKQKDTCRESRRDVEVKALVKTLVTSQQK